MSISLHHALVPQWIQMIDGLERVLTKADSHCGETERSEDEFVQMKLAPDMLDFAYQVKSVRTHSIGAVEGVRAGVFSPDMSESPRDFAAMRTMLSQTRDAINALDPAEFEGFIGKPVEFRFRDFVMPFDGEEFLLSFSQPNFYFHVTTAYAILRQAGVAVGKFDYLGSVRKKVS
ncbi:DUF1993 family protein [uncultured Croceicoccus sp.]|uniref:DUF1993 domain-containing protein n=1 Tax=uncultured Croceicoccus sp. TaxID=1295329 RepID=UPI00262A1F3A|nr:DUF1993 domain-containing protein [uncultured Croceicoccus sp.]